MKPRALGVLYPVMYTACAVLGLVLIGSNLPKDAEHLPIFVGILLVFGAGFLAGRSRAKWTALIEKIEAAKRPPI